MQATPKTAPSPRDTNAEDDQYRRPTCGYSRDRDNGDRQLGPGTTQLLSVLNNFNM